MNCDRVVALGFFDGVHLGHRRLLRRAREEACQRGCLAAALTFDPHPDTLIFGVQTPLITTLADRRRLMTDLCAMDEVIVLPFDRSMMELPWQDFAGEVLLHKLKAVHVVCGDDFSFGYKGLGNSALLRDFCTRHHIGCDIIDKVESEGQAISSTRIRRLLQEGQTEAANRLLGHCHFFTGRVIRGKQLGRTLGFPTANIPLPPELLVPACGVYATRVTLPDGSRHEAVTNVGYRPTVEQSDRIMTETWLPDYEGDLYDRILQVEFCKFLRKEQKFDHVQALTEAIRRDGEAAKAWFETT